MGGWTASSFSVEQQGKYGVNDEGVVVDQDCFDAAIESLKMLAKRSWPELVGTGAVAAQSLIQSECPWLQVTVMPHDAMMTMDVRDDRVRILARPDGMVDSSPTVG
eukprot:gene5061-26934_t